MDSINISNSINRIIQNKNQNSNKIKSSKNITEGPERASSLSALSDYGRAMVSFSKNPSNKPQTFAQQLEEFKQRVSQSESLKDIDFEDSIQEENIALAEKLCFGQDENGNEVFTNKKLIPNILYYCLSQVQEGNRDFLCEPCDIKDIIDFTHQLCIGKDEQGNDLFPDKDCIFHIISELNQSNIQLAKELCFGKDDKGNDIFADKKLIGHILYQANKYNIEFIRTLCIGKDENGNDICPQKDYITKIIGLYTADPEKFPELMQNPNVKDNPDISEDLMNQYRNMASVIRDLCIGKDKDGNYLFPQRELAYELATQVREENCVFIKDLCFGKDENGNDLFPDKESITEILQYSHSGNIDINRNICLGTESKEPITPALEMITCVLPYTYKQNNQDIFDVLDLYREYKCSLDIVKLILEKQITIESYKKIDNLLGKEKLSQLSTSAIKTAIKCSNLYGKHDVNEIDIKEKKEAIRTIVELNTSLYDASKELADIFPLLPSNKDEYCDLLKSLCKSIGIETNELNDAQIADFNTSMQNLADILAALSDEEFNDVEITQDYNKKDFIKNTYEIVKDLSPSERQKVYDYFGFELKQNNFQGQKGDNPEDSLSIIGYPINLNNGKKLAKIDKENTRSIVEKLRPEVIKFSQNNHIHCSNNKIEEYINTIIELCPELRTQIGRTQHGHHQFDVFKHSLKVMQKTAQNPEFAKLEQNDKQILLLAALLHDSNKLEGCKDPVHPDESAFDAFYITKKFKINNNDAAKLYSLIKNHEWLGYTNTKELNEEERENRLRSVAYDLHYNNLFAMSKILTEADLKAVKKDNGFYNDVKSVFNTNSEKIQSYIEELKNSQPFLPVTKIPSAQRIKEAITNVNSDLSTNIKGLYLDENGMVIIKYNEVENESWEKLGFPTGSISRGIENSSVNTGNIKFFAHGLNKKEQLSNFNVFAFPDSYALLSVSYMERPESKYRLFRTQGVLLDVDFQYVHGGGETDSGSGCKKTIDIFKNDYAFKNGKRHSDRVFIANLIKEALNLTDDEYKEFIETNKNKAIVEIEPKEYQEKLVQAFATINSRTRRGERNYNEMYVSNPHVMGVFAYSAKDNVGDVMNFIKEQPDFLKQYAIDEDVPFIIFGD